MRVTFFTAVIDVQIGNISGRGDEIFKGLYITTDSDIISELMTPEVRAAIGQLEYEFLRNAPAFVYSRKEVEGDFSWSEYLRSRLFEVKTLFNVMWLFKDNAANSELGFLTYPFGLTQLTHSNTVSITYDMADGSRAEVPFSRNDLKEVRQYYRAWIGEIEDSMPYGLLDSSGVTRTMRAFYWIQAGRSAPSLGQRIACFCTAMESLVATSSSELAHQLAERMAMFLSDQTDERETVYRKVKQCYAFRSRVVHGDVLKHSKVSELVEASLACDELLRQAIRKAVQDEHARRALEGSNETLDHYFLNALLSGS